MSMDNIIRNSKWLMTSYIGYGGNYLNILSRFFEEMDIATEQINILKILKIYEIWFVKVTYLQKLRKLHPLIADVCMLCDLLL